jgi:hypothetical protein
MTIDHDTLRAIFLQPQFFARVATSIPAEEVARLTGRSARALVFSQLAAKQWRTQRAFASA